MSVVEYNLLNSKVSTREAAEKDVRVDMREGVHRADTGRRVGSRDICLFTRQLATLLRAGMPLVPALSALVEQMQAGPLAAIVEDVRDSVNAGSSLACVLGKYPGVFSNLFVNMVAAGEASGSLEEVLVRLAEILNKRVHLTS